MGFMSDRQYYSGPQPWALAFNQATEGFMKAFDAASKRGLAQDELELKKAEQKEAFRQAQVRERQGEEQIGMQRQQLRLGQAQAALLEMEAQKQQQLQAAMKGLGEERFPTAEGDLVSGDVAFGQIENLKRQGRTLGAIDPKLGQEYMQRAQEWEMKETDNRRRQQAFGLEKSRHEQDMMLKAAAELRRESEMRTAQNMIKENASMLRGLGIKLPAEGEISPEGVRDFVGIAHTIEKAKNEREMLSKQHTMEVHRGILQTQAKLLQDREKFMVEPLGESPDMKFARMKALKETELELARIQTTLMGMQNQMVPGVHPAKAPVPPPPPPVQGPPAPPQQMDQNKLAAFFNLLFSGAPPAQAGQPRRGSLQNRRMPWEREGGPTHGYPE